MRSSPAARLAAAACLVLALALAAAHPVRAQTGSPLNALSPAACPANGSEEVYGIQSGADRKFGSAQIPFCSAAATNTPNTFTGKQTLPASTTTNAGLNLGQGAGPSSPLNGDVWITPSGVFAEVNGATAALGVTVPTASAGGSNTDVQYNCSSVLCGNSGFTYNGSVVTFPDGSTWGPGGISGLLGPLAFSGTGGAITDGSASVKLAFPGSGRVDVKTGSTELMQFLNNAGAGELNVNTGGVIGFGSTANPAVAFSQIGADELALGNGTAGDETGKLDLKVINLPTTGGGVINLADKGSLTSSADTFGGYLQFSNWEFADPTAGMPGGMAGLITSGWTPGAGFAFMGVPQGGGTYISPQSSYGMGWDLQFFNELGYQIFGIEHGAEDNHSLQLGAVRACTVMYTTCGPSQLMFTDAIWNGAITGLGSLVGGSGYVNGTYPDVPLTGSATGILGRADITVAGGAVTSAVLHTPARGGFWYHVGDVLTTSNSNLGGSGSGFSITTTNVSSGAAAGPVIMMQSPIDFVGFGQAAVGADAATSENAIRFGGAGNSGFPWDSNPPDQPSLTMGGALILGVGVTEEAQLRGNSGGGIDITAPWSTTPATLSFGIPFFKGTNTAGSGSASLGANSPAVTNSAPYTWLQAKSADGSTVFIPAWK